MIALMFSFACAAPSVDVSLPPLLNDTAWVALRIAEEGQIAQDIEDAVSLEDLHGSLDVPETARIVRWGLVVDRFDGTGTYFYVVRVDRPGERPVRTRCRVKAEVPPFTFAPGQRNPDFQAIYTGMGPACPALVDERLQAR